MKRDFTHENFEEFLKRSADGLRMKAPDKVWQNLSKELNKRRRRTIFGLSAFLLISAAIGYSVISNVPTQAVSEARPETSKAISKTQTSSQPAQAAELQPQVSSRRSSVSSATPFVNQPNTSPVPGLFESPRSHQPAFGHSDAAELQSGTLTANPEEAISDESQFTPTVVDSYTEFDESPVSTQKTSLSEEPKTAGYPLTVESVINSYKATNKKRRFETQFYFTPTISYRKLSENKSYLRSLDPNLIPSNYPALHSSVNNNVTHKPDLGFEMGFAAKYALSNKLKIKAGLQFNINRYEIKAFSSQWVNATIALNNGGRIDSFTTRTGYSAVKENGYRTNWLRNLSFQASLPIGAEYIFSENENIQFGFGATVQPTYVLNDRAYLITTDYKNYTQADWLVRRWNVNTAFETFVNINSGKTRWQIGPQVRYQLLSSFISKYPVKENLFDFGLKVGVSLGK